MKVLFDHQIFCMQRHGGISRCFVEIYKHLPSNCQARFSVLESDNAYLAEMGIGHPIGYNYQHFILPFHWPYKGKMFTAYNMMRSRGRDYHWNVGLYNKAESISLLKKGSYDVFHPTFFDDYFLPYLNGKPFVLTIHDMIPELYPQYFARDDFQIVMKRKLAPLASAIVAVSETTKNDIIRILGVPEEKVHVIYHGCSFPEIKYPQRLYDFPYILYVGERGAYKNFNLFVKGIEPVLKKHKELKVVCTGRSFDDDERRQIDELGLKDKFVQRWVKSDAEMYSLYHYAMCFVYPSEYEGFGIPILEAYKAGCPVMLNRASCFSEIAADAAIYFNMDKKGTDIAKRLVEFLSWSTESKEKLLSMQRQRLSRYSWERSAQQYKELYEKILEK